MNLAELKEAYKAKKLAFDTAKKEEEKYKALLKDAMLEAVKSWSVHLLGGLYLPQITMMQGEKEPPRSRGY